MKITQQLAHQPAAATVHCALCPLQENEVLPLSQQPKCPTWKKHHTVCLWGKFCPAVTHTGNLGSYGANYIHNQSRA